MVHYPSTSKRKGRPSLVRALVLLGKKTEFVSSILEESEDAISRFEIIWPLEQKSLEIFWTIWWHHNNISNNLLFSNFIWSFISPFWWNFIYGQSNCIFFSILSRLFLFKSLFLFNHGYILDFLQFFNIGVIFFRFGTPMPPSGKRSGTSAPRCQVIVKEHIFFSYIINKPTTISFLSACSLLRSYKFVFVNFFCTIFCFSLYFHAIFGFIPSFFSN